VHESADSPDCILILNVSCSTDFSHMQLDIALKAAQQAADAAEQTIQSHLDASDWSVSYKSDDSPVTEVDVASEEAIRAVLLERTPEIAFYGEETGHSNVESQGTAANGSADNLWLVDPIDGTKSFIRNMPFYSTQIALQLKQQLVVGVSNAPAYGERLYASKGNGAWYVDTSIAGATAQQVQCRDTKSLNNAFLSTGNLGRLAKQSDAWTVLAEIVKQVRRVRGYGDFCHYHQLCRGQADLIIESDVNILDIAALTVAVREAGGVITDLSGGAIDVNTTSVLAAGTAELHNEVLALFEGVFDTTLSA